MSHLYMLATIVKEGPSKQEESIANLLMFRGAVNPKTTTYSIDGTGRDTYISFNNGGVLKNFCLDRGGYERGKMELRKQYCRPHARIYGKMKHYLVDGTGRDTYINYNQGGLSDTDSRTSRQFIKNLRQYQPLRVSLSSFKVEENKKRSSSTFTRLSVPKYKEDPYDDVRRCYRKRQL